jgi:integrase
MECLAVLATLTGLEPATSAVTGRRANQLRHRALLLLRVTA